MTGGDAVTRSPLVTLSTTYGAGGSTVGPQVAQRLGVPFLDRAIATDVAERLGLSESEPEEPRSGLQRCSPTSTRLSPVLTASDPLRAAPEATD